jgi:hypothetical protein
MTNVKLVMSVLFTKKIILMVYKLESEYEGKIIRRVNPSENNPSRIVTLGVFHSKDITNLIFETINFLLSEDEGTDVIQIKKIKFKDNI